MTREEIQELIADLKLVRNAVYEITTGSNPHERKVAQEKACSVVHDVTEKYKKMERTCTS